MAPGQGRSSWGPGGTKGLHSERCARRDEHGAKPQPCRAMLPCPWPLRFLSHRERKETENREGITEHC